MCARGAAIVVLAAATGACSVLTSLDGLTGGASDAGAPFEARAAPPSSDPTTDAGIPATIAPKPASDAGAGDTASGEDASDAEVAAVDAPSSSIDRAEYNFEIDVQGWAPSSGEAPNVSVAQSTQEAFAGTHSLAVSFVASSEVLQDVGGPPPSSLGPSNEVVFHVYVPGDAGVESVQPFVIQGASGNWLWTGNVVQGAALNLDAWTAIAITVPVDATPPLYKIGVELKLAASSVGTVYVDSVAW